MKKPIIKNKKNILLFAVALGALLLLFAGCLGSRDYSNYRQSRKQGAFKADYSQSVSSNGESSFVEENFSSSTEIVSEENSSRSISADGGSSQNYSTSGETVVESQSRQESEQTAPSTDSPPTENTVWITRKGKRYHSSSSCSNMKNPYTVTLEQARASGRTACRKCW